MAQTSAPTEDRAIFADLMSLPAADRYPKLDLSPELRRKRTIDAVMRRLETTAREQPVLAIFEDVHWIDPSSLDVLNRMIDRIRDLPVLLLVTFRPEFAPPWTGQSHVTTLALTRLVPRATADLVQRIIGNKVLPDDVIRDRRAHRRGPVVRRGADQRNNRDLDRQCRSRSGRCRSIRSAATLHASLMARLDRLGPAKGVARLAAAIGREFSYELLFAVAELTESELTSALDRLTAAGLLFREGTPPHATYLFKHALVRDAAYGLLLREPKRQLHARIGAKFEEDFPDVAEAHPDILAYHFAEGGSDDKAVEYWLKAGKQLVSRANMTEALSQLNKCSLLLSKMPDTAWRRQHEFTVQLAIASALIARLGAAAPEVGEAYERVRQLWELVGRPSSFEPKLALFWHHLTRGELEVADDVAKDLVAVGSSRGDVAINFLGRMYSAETSFYLGDFDASLAYSEHALAIYDPVLVSQRLLQNGRVYSLLRGAGALFGLGYPQRARLQMQRALIESSELSHVYKHANALFQSLWIQHWSEPTQTVLQHAEELAATQFAFLSLQGSIYRGWCVSMLGREQEGVRLIVDALSAYRVAGTLIWVPFFLLLLAEAFGMTGNPPAALEQLNEALGLVANTKEKWCEAEL
jgi:tetratricopeptide (TPR) repeat protein